MLSGKEIQTTKELSDGHRVGDRIYFLCKYVLSEPGTTIIPMYIATPRKIYYHSVFLYSFDTGNETLSRLAVLKPSSVHTGSGDIKCVRWTADGSLLYLMYNTGWDKTTKKSVYDVFRYTPGEKEVAEVTGDGREKLIARLFPGSFWTARKKNMLFTEVWYHVGGLPADAWGLVPPTDYSKPGDRECVNIIVEQRGDRYLREAVFRKLKPSLSPGKAEDIIKAMEKRSKKLPGDRRMMYIPYCEEWYARLRVEALYGTAAENGTLEAALFKKDREGTDGFLKKDPDVNRKDDKGRTPLMIAAYADNAEGIEALLKRGADINARDKTGRTPLLYAVFGRAPHALELLLKHGADHKLQTTNGWNAWMFVANTELRQRFLKNTGR